MDINSLYYFVEFAKDLNMTHAANRLFISQQTLSNHIQRLENNLGATLLYRKPKPSLTAAGETLLTFAKTVIQEHKNLQDTISDISHEERGVLRFGASRFRMDNFIPNIIEKYSAEYPHVQLNLVDAVSSKLEPMVMDGQLDFALILDGDPNPRLMTHDLLKDQIYICVADSLLKQYYGEEAENLKNMAKDGTTVKGFDRLPFCLFNNRLGRQIMNCFDEISVKPNIYMTSSYMEINVSACCRRLAACFASQMGLANMYQQIPEDINVFPLMFRGKPVIQNLLVVYLKERYLPSYSKFFLEKLLEYFANIEQKSFTRAAGDT